MKYKSPGFSIFMGTLLISKSGVISKSRKLIENISQNFPKYIPGSNIYIFENLAASRSQVSQGKIRVPW